MNAVYLEDPKPWLVESGLYATNRSYDDATKAWLAASGHYLDAPPPGAILCCALTELERGLFGPVPGPQLLGLCLLGRPVARMLPQDGTWAEITRFVLVAGLPKGTASHLLRVAAELWCARPASERLITYHDRTRHTGCIYRKSGFVKDGVTRAGTRQGSWATRTGSRAEERRMRTGAAELLTIAAVAADDVDKSAQPSKRRWRIDAADVRAALAARSAVDVSTCS